MSAIHRYASGFIELPDTTATETRATDGRARLQFSSSAPYSPPPGTKKFAPRIEDADSVVSEFHDKHFARVRVRRHSEGPVHLARRASLLTEQAELFFLDDRLRRS
ncbi:MAG TPA: hypothetical protein VIT89_04100 [Solirubrobacterales bacterium]